MSSIESRGRRSYRETDFPPPETPWRDASFCVIDLELTGLDPASDEIISFATVTVSGGRVRLDDARYELVRPKRMPDWDTIRIHGLREMDLEEAPPLDGVIDTLLEALAGRPLVAHVAEVERSFLDAVLSSFGAELRNPIIDTATLSREWRQSQHLAPLRSGAGTAGKEVSSPGLSGVARSLGLPIHRPHHADGDALTTAQVFIALATHLDSLQPQTVGTLQQLSLRRERKAPLFKGLLLRFGFRHD